MRSELGKLIDLHLYPYGAPELILVTRKTALIELAIRECI